MAGPDETSSTTAAPVAPAHRYSPKMANEIEARWQERWRREGTFEAPNPSGALASPSEAAARPKTYVLDMFPYPSGAGLHVGHPLGYIATDVFGRFKRMTGHNVLHAFGFDAFGLPAEQYAVQTGQHPRVTTQRNIAAIRTQLRRLGLAHDERRSVSTTDPAFYRWTQWIFLQIFNSWYDDETDRARPIDELIDLLASGERAMPTGVTDVPDGTAWAALDELSRRRVVDSQRLAYVADAPVNWCPALGTVLADEEVTLDGRSERGSFPVFKRDLRQWMMRITAYAPRLLSDLEALDWPESIKAQQRHWIGRSEGAHIRFRTSTCDVDIFSTRPDTLFGATFLALSPSHPAVDELTARAWPRDAPSAWTQTGTTPADAVEPYRVAAPRANKPSRGGAAPESRPGVWTGAYATNPATGQLIPVFVADYVLMTYGTGAVMGVPGQDERDWRFAEQMSLPIVRTVQPPAGWQGDAYPGDGVTINSASTEISLDGLTVTEARTQIVEWLERTGHGSAAVTYRLRDWLFSRQRYWGEPFPIVYDEHDLPMRSPRRFSRSSCPRSTTTRPGPSSRTTWTPYRSPRSARNEDGPPSSSTFATADAATGVRRTRCRSGPARAGTSCATSTRRTANASSTRRSSATGWAHKHPDFRAASTCTSVAPSTPSCTCSMPGSGTRCSSTSDTSPAASRSIGCSTRA